jgi:hypothetical protein
VKSPSDIEIPIDVSAPTKPEANRPQRARRMQLSLPADLAPGTVVAGRYRIVRRLGQGGMGIVFVAEHQRLERKVALKVLTPVLARHKILVQRFEREARAASKIGHHNIVNVLDFGSTDEGADFIVMELLEGCDLGRVIRTTGALLLERTIRITQQICAADVYAVGIILYEMLTGSVPFHGADAATVIAGHLSGTLKPASRRAPHIGIPRALEGVIERALMKDAAARFSSMRDLAAAIDYALGDDARAARLTVDERCPARRGHPRLDAAVRRERAAAAAPSRRRDRRRCGRDRWGRARRRAPPQSASRDATRSGGRRRAHADRRSSAARATAALARGDDRLRPERRRRVSRRRAPRDHSAALHPRRGDQRARRHHLEARLVAARPARLDDGDALVRGDVARRRPPAPDDPDGDDADEAARAAAKERAARAQRRLRRLA